MEQVEQLRLVGTTAADGTLTLTAAVDIVGALYAVQWIDGSLADGVDAVLSVVNADADYTLLTLTNADNDDWYYRQVPCCDAAGAAIAGAYTLPMIVGKPKLTITAGGDTKKGGAVLCFVRH
jgi:hypothetical protein